MFIDSHYQIDIYIESYSESYIDQVANEDIVGTPVGAASKSLFSTYHMASMNCANTTARRED